MSLDRAEEIEWVRLVQCVGRLSVSTLQRNEPRNEARYEQRARKGGS